MFKHLALSTFLLVPALALAQDGLVRDFKPADFERIIKEDFRKEFDKKQGKIGFEYDIKDTDYYALFNPGEKFLLFFVRAPGQGVTLEQLNTWNRDAIFSRAYLAGNTMIFEVPLSFAAGTSRDIVKSYYAGFEKEYEAFKKALKGN